MSATDDISLDPIVFDLRDEDPAVRSQAATVLGLSGNPMVVEYLMSTLAYDEDVQVRRSAAIGLGNLGHPSALQPLLMALQLEDDELRTFAAEAIAKIDSDDSVDLLLIALNGHPSMQLGAMDALARIGDRRALEPLEAMVPSTDAAVEAMRQHALVTLRGEVKSAYDTLLDDL